jgi:predicted acetyltransferase
MVLPEKQGKGFASELIRRHLHTIDDDGLPCFLATQDPMNCDIYKRYGFEITSEDEVSNSGVISYAMLRPAKANCL